MNEILPTKLNIYQRLSRVRETVGYLQKDKQVGEAGKSWGYKAVTHDAVTAHLRPEFIKHGVMVVPNVVDSRVVPTGTTTAKGVPHIRYEGRFCIRFVNIDEPGDCVESVLDSHAIDDADKAPGKAISYATKYAMLKVLSIETGEDDESRIEVDAAGDELVQKAVEAIGRTASTGELKKVYSEAVETFAGNKAALRSIEAAKDAKLAAAKMKAAGATQ